MPTGAVVEDMCRPLGKEQRSHRCWPVPCAHFSMCWAIFGGCPSEIRWVNQSMFLCRLRVITRWQLQLGFRHVRTHAYITSWSNKCVLSEIEKNVLHHGLWWFRTGLDISQAGQNHMKSNNILIPTILPRYVHKALQTPYRDTRVPETTASHIMHAGDAAQLLHQPGQVWRGELFRKCPL